MIQSFLRHSCSKICFGRSKGKAELSLTAFVARTTRNNFTRLKTSKNNQQLYWGRFSDMQVVQS